MSDRIEFCFHTSSTRNLSHAICDDCIEKNTLATKKAKYDLQVVTCGHCKKKEFMINTSDWFVDARRDSLDRLEDPNDAIHVCPKCRFD
jgi:hypothetical protein